MEIQRCKTKPEQEFMPYFQWLVLSNAIITLDYISVSLVAKELMPCGQP